METKKCKVCQLNKSLDDFNGTKYTKSGYEGKCKDCRKDKRKEFSKFSQDIIRIAGVKITEKKCAQCKQILSGDSFNKDSSRGDGLDTSCRMCRSNFNQGYAQRDYVKDQNRIRNKELKSQQVENGKIYYEENKEKILQAQKKYSQSIDGKFVQYKSFAKKRGLEFSLNKEDFLSLESQPCHYCHAQMETIGLDRIEPTVGFIITNVVMCCTACTYCKLNKSPEAFKEYTKEIAKVWSSHGKQ